MSNSHKSATQKSLDWFNMGVVKRYRDEHMCSLFEAKRICIDLAITEALKHVRGWEDCLAIMKFQHVYKAQSL